MVDSINKTTEAYNKGKEVSGIYNAGDSAYIDEQTAKMAIENLEKAAKKGIDEAILRLTYIPKDNKNLTYKEKYKYSMGN